MKAYLPLAAALAAAPLHAQSNPTLPTTDDKGETIVVTASRSGDGVRADQLGASVTVLDAQALRDRQTRIVSDILRDVPGVAVNRVGAVGGLTQIRIRGTEANHVLVLIDGIEASDPYQGEFDFGTLIADEAAKIEVLRGQQSALYGSDAIGGVIQYITLTGGEDPGLHLRAEGGSFDTLSGGARVAGVAGALDYALTASGYHTGGTPTARNGTRDVGSDTVGASGKATWSPSDSVKLTAVGRYNYGDADINNSEFNPASPLFGFTIDSPGSHMTNNSFYGLLRGELLSLDGRWSNTLSGQLADTTRKTFDAFGFSFGDKGRRYKGSYESALRFGGDRIKHRFTGAVDVEREEFRTLGAPSPFMFTGERHTTNTGLVGQYELTADDVSFGASLRHDFNSRFADATTYRVQGSYRLGDGPRVRAAYGTGIKNPGYFELYGFSNGRYIGNPDLKPEKSKGWEAGIEQNFAAGNATVGATYFDSKLTDEIFTTFPPPAFVATPGNRATGSKQRGLEVFASARPLQAVRFDLAYTHLHARENGAVEVRRPDDIASGNLTLLSKDERFSATLTARYNGDQTDVAFTNPSFVPVTVKLDSYVLVNLAAEYKLTSRLALYGRVENLLGEHYEEVFSYRTPGRAAYGGVRLSL